MKTHGRWLLAAALLAAALMTGCGGDDGADGGTGDGTATADPRDAALAFAQCMREHGVDVPDPKPGTEDGGQVIIGPGGAAGADRKTFEAAHKACAKHLADVPGAGGPGTLTEEDKERMLETARCFREHGVDVPDPDFDSGGTVEIPLGDPGDEKFEAARKACGDLIAGGAG